MREGKKVGNRTFHELTPLAMIAALEDKVGRECAKRTLVVVARMFRVAGAKEERLVPGLEVAARLAELYMEYLDPSGNCLAVPMESLVKTINSVKPEMKKPVEVSDALPLQNKAMVVEPRIFGNRPTQVFELTSVFVPAVPEVPHPMGKSSRIRALVMKMRNAGWTYFQVCSIGLLEGESLTDVNNAISSLISKNLIMRVGKGTWAFVGVDLKEKEMENSSML